MLKYTKKLKELNKDSLFEAGGKGVNLGILANAKLPVPPAFVVTTNAYSSHLEKEGIKGRIRKRIEEIKGKDINEITKASKDIRCWIEEAPMSMEIQKQLNKDIDSLFKELNKEEGIAVAVRSSATAEDLPNASFAGQHETYLGVYGKENIFKYVKKCWASLWSPQAINYRITMKIKDIDINLAVVVQAMIDSDVAGVMFTANPINGKRDEMLISAGYGLGESVVSGLITPDSFILTKDGEVKEKKLGSKKTKIKLTSTGTVTKEISKEKQEQYTLKIEELMKLGALGRLVENHYGSPQDTEWAISNGEIYLLQARPITTKFEDDFVLLESEDEIIYKGKEPSFWLQSIIEHTPHPHTPLDFACLSHFYKGINTFFSEVGIQIPEDSNKPVERKNGSVALKYKDPIISKVNEEEGFASYTKGIDKKKLWKEFLEYSKMWIKTMDKFHENINDQKELIEFINKAMKDYEDFVYKRFSFMKDPDSKEGLRLNNLIEKAVGKNNSSKVKESLFRELPFRTALQNEEFLKLAYIKTIKGENSQLFKNEMKKFLKEYGDKTSMGSGRMLSPSTWNENPQKIEEIIAALYYDKSILDLDERVKKKKKDYNFAKEQVKNALEAREYREFKKLLEEERNTIIIREESVFYLERITGSLHRMCLKLGTLLEKKNFINSEEDVFFIFIEELDLVSKGELDIKEKVRKRKKAFNKVCEASDRGIHWLVSTGSIPAFKSEKNIEKYEGENTSVIRGSSASVGEYEGKVCIVRNISEFKKLKKGDILVSTYTDPLWTPLFKIASAIVTEIGSATSHAAIVAREYGIPAVVAIDNVVKLLKDGQRIKVDGTKGVIILEE